MKKKIVLLATSRYSINVDDFYMFYRRTGHQIVSILYHYTCQYKRWWQDNRFYDPARNYLFDPLDFDLYQFGIWYHVDDLLEMLAKLDFDYVCMGNGTGQEQQAVVAHVGREKCLFSEYGWLPWSEHFYISRDGCGRASDLARGHDDAYQGVEIRYQEINGLANKLDKGKKLTYRDFIYVPLQKDINDFKFLTSPFPTNEAFLDFIHEVTPREIPVFVKPHPLYKKSYDLSKYGRGRFIDISGHNYSKRQLYQNMLAMICINSTSILEALAFSGRIFAYGEDIYNHKNLLYYRVFDESVFQFSLGQEISEDLRLRFVSLLMERQISRSRCLNNDQKYIATHYWNKCL